MNRTIKHLLLTLLLFVGTLSSAKLIAQDAILKELDQMLATADNFVKVREAHIANIESMLNTQGITTMQKYNIYKNLYNEYRAFQFDHAMEMLDNRYELSQAMGNRSLMADDQIERALLYASSGMFFEAGKVLDHEIDTLHLSREQLINYYNAQQRFHTDFWHYTSDSEIRNNSGLKKDYYRSRILEITSPNESIHKYITIRNLSEQGEWEKAEALNRELLSNYQPDQHEYAMYAYDRARILEALQRRDEMREWFARSAMADIRTATKDNAALCSLAQNLLECNDVDRAFHYITLSLNDALFYNAKLRPWQISGVIPEIEKAYQLKQHIQNENLAKQEEHSRYLAIIISILAITLLAICFYMAILLRRSHNDTRKIREMNDHIVSTNDELQLLNQKMAAINSDLREANAVKEEYIALFLSMCSDYIEKLTTMQRNIRRKISQGKIADLEKELSSSSIMDEELHNFYQMFDNAFLSLYPNFVDEFNALLKPEAHFEPKRGELLNTELRIFALIRLGICDSSRIASLLRYSVNTIYNYRARTKNNALEDRDGFEERVKTIGK